MDCIYNLYYVCITNLKQQIKTNTMKATFTMHGERQEVMIITEYSNGYFWIEMKNGEDRVVHKTYITKH